MICSVLFSTPKKWNPLSALVRWGTNCAASHVALCVDSTELGCPVVLEAHTTGFRMIPLSAFVEKNILSYSVPVEIDSGAFAAAVKWLGGAYDFGGLLGMAIVVVGRKLGLSIKNPFASNGAMFCSEAVARILRMSGKHLPGLPEEESASPADLLVSLVREP